MVAAVRVHKTGGPEVLTLDDIDIPAPGQGQIKIKQHACGVNFIDTYFRIGMYPSPVGLPFVSGNEGAGQIIEVGPGVTDLKVGDRVAYVVPLGGYAAVCHSCTNVLAGSFLIIRPSVRSVGIKPHWRESPLRIPSPSSTSIPGGTTTVPAVTGSTESGTASPATAATRLIARWPSGS